MNMYNFNFLILISLTRKSVLFCDKFVERSITFTRHECCVTDKFLFNYIFCQENITVPSFFLVFAKYLIILTASHLSHQCKLVRSVLSNLCGNQSK